MIVVITNRQLHGSAPENTPAWYPIRALGNELGEQGNICGILQKKNGRDGIKLYPYGGEKQLFAFIVDKIDSADADQPMRRPWVMFVHGFNQSIEKNIAKARNLESRRKVNVIVFSWPSQPEPGKTDKVMKTIKSKAISKFVKGGLTAAVLGSLTDYIVDYWKTYTLARQNAEKSADDMARAYRVVQNQLIKQVRRKLKISLLVHSLGHYLTQNTVIKHNGIAARFEHIILHQADADTVEQKSWIPGLLKSASHIYVTINKYDSVLAVSQVYNQKARLGHSQQGFIASNKISYVDFTGMPTTIWSDGTGSNLNENSHDLYNLARKDCADDIYFLIEKLVRSEKPGLPGLFSKTGAGFVKTRKKTNYCQPVEIVDDFGDVVSPLD